MAVKVFLQCGSGFSEIMLAGVLIFTAGSLSHVTYGVVSKQSNIFTD